MNVGGKNIIAKEKLCQLFTDLGFENVRTYIQSGNILFRSDKKSTVILVKKIEAALTSRFSYTARAVVLSHEHYKSAMRSAPILWGKDDRQKHNALFTLGNQTPKQVYLKLPHPVQNIESISLGEHVIFWSVSKEKLTKSAFMKLASLQVYQDVTIRNHNTALKLLHLFDDI